MFEIKELIWMLPILFIIHDFEEIILVKSWVRSNEKLFSENRKFKPYAGFAGTEAFSVAVLEELIIIVAVVLYSSITENYIVWFGLLFVVVAHFVPHILSMFIFKGFVPGAFTGTLFLPFGIYLMYKSIQLFPHTLNGVIISCAVCTAIFLVNLKWLHKIMPRFDKVISKMFDY